MILNKKFIEFLIEINITIEQYMFMSLIYLGELNTVRDYGMCFSKEMIIDDLIEREYLLSNGSDLITTQKFDKFIVQDDELAATKVWKIWWGVIDVNGKKYSAKGMDYDDFVIMYSNIIKSDVSRHNEIVEITTNFVKSTPVCPMALKKYIGTRYFDDIADTYSNTKFNDSSFIKDR